MTDIIDISSWAGLRSDPSGLAKTLVVGVDEVLPRLSAQDLEVLSRFEFRTSVDYNFGNASADRGNGPLIKVLHGNAASPMIAYDDEYVAGINGNAQGALERLRTVLHEEMSKVELQPGDILLLDNLRVGSTRTSVIFNLDLVFASLFGLLNKEPLSSAQVVGGAIIFLASMLESTQSLLKKLYRGAVT